VEVRCEVGDGGRVRVVLVAGGGVEETGGVDAGGFSWGEASERASERTLSDRVNKNKVKTERGKQTT
jgi:hypothetical protein